MNSGTGDRWERLGALLIQRRTQLSPRFHNRGAFCEAAGLNYRLVYDIEEARRTNFGRSALAAIEAAYRLTPGAIGRFLAGGKLGTQPVTADAAAAADAIEVRREAVRRPSPAPAAPGDLMPDDILPPGFPRPPDPEIAWRLPWLALAVQAEVRAAEQREGVPAADLSGAALFGEGTYEAWLWTTYEAVMPDIRWRVATIALTRAITELGDPSAQSAS